MREIDLQKLDLNLLKVFVALMKEGSVTTAAARLGTAQSSLSHSLGRLRAVLGDPLFVRTTTGMQPTPYAVQLFEPISAALMAVQAAFDEAATFDPGTSSRTFNLVMTDVCELIFLPRLMAHVRAEAPSAAVRVLQLPRNEYREALEGGDADIALGQLPPGHNNFFKQQIGTEGFVCVMRRDHPLSRNLTLDGFLAAEHLIVDSPATVGHSVKDALGELAVKRKIKLHLPHFMLAPFVIANTDLIAALPDVVATTYEPSADIVQVPLPFEVQPVQVLQYWHHRTNLDASCQWLRGVIFKLFGSPRG